MFGILRSDTLGKRQGLSCKMLSSVNRLGFCEGTESHGFSDSSIYGSSLVPLWLSVALCECRPGPRPSLPSARLSGGAPGFGMCARYTLTPGKPLPQWTWRLFSV